MGLDIQIAKEKKSVETVDLLTGYRKAPVTENPLSAYLLTDTSGINFDT